MFYFIQEQPPLSSILHGGSGGTVLYSSIENARNTVNFAQSQLARELQMEYAQQPMTSQIVCLPLQSNFNFLSFYLRIINKNIQLKIVLMLVINY